MTDRNVIVRSATPADAALLADLGRRTFVGAFGDDNDPARMDEYVATAFTEDRLEEELTDPSAQFLIAEKSGVPLGYAKIRKAPPPDCVYGDSPFEIERIYADQSVIGTGVGSVLMGECLEAIRRMGGDAMWLGVWEHNERAIRFYEKWDFEIVGAKEFVLGGESQTDVVMVSEV